MYPVLRLGSVGPEVGAVHLLAVGPGQWTKHARNNVFILSLFYMVLNASPLWSLAGLDVLLGLERDFASRF